MALLLRVKETVCQALTLIQKNPLPYLTSLLLVRRAKDVVVDSGWLLSTLLPDENRYGSINFPTFKPSNAPTPAANIVTSICLMVNFIISTTFSLEIAAALRN